MSQVAIIMGSKSDFEIMSEAIEILKLFDINTVYDIVANSNDHTTLKTAISACSLDGALSGPGPFTFLHSTSNNFQQKTQSLQNLCWNPTIPYLGPVGF